MNTKFLLSIVILKFLLLHYDPILADAPKNYFKGKFYKSVENYFLVATAQMRDARFKKTVILMLDNDENGSWGFVINKSIGSISLAELINISQEERDEKETLYNEVIPIFWGGPVDETRIFILHSKEYKNESTRHYKDISISRDYKTLFDIAQKKGPKKSMVILGYSGWASGQLE